MFSLLNRVYTSFNPPVAEKTSDAIKFGVLGAAKITPMALILAAKSHPEVIVQAVAARDRARAKEFARKNGIPDVKDTYQDILDDPNIDAVFIPLPNALHYELAVRAIRAGKHVLLEKPSTDNAAEADILFNLPELSRSPSQPEPPVLLEAFHNRFHPSVHKFMSFITPADMVHVHTDNMVPWWFVGKDDLEYNYDMGGGSIMALGTYNFALLRMIFGDEPEMCLSCDATTIGDGLHDQCDHTFKAQFRFPNGIGEAMTTIRGPVLWKPSEARVTHREVVVPDETLGKAQEKVLTVCNTLAVLSPSSSWEGQRAKSYHRLHEFAKVQQRQVTLHGCIHTVLWHRIDVKDSYMIRSAEDGRPIRQWVESNSYKAYSNRDLAGESGDSLGEDWWMSYRYQLEAFLNRVKGRKTEYWVSGNDSINQMRMVDMAYAKSGLGLRPTSAFR